jgi:hypothetical protein
VDPADTVVQAPSGREPDAPDRPARVVSWLAAAVTALAVLRVGVLAMHRRTVPEMQDLWETLLPSMSASRFEQLTGMWSRIGIYHPGPMFFYWSAPFVRLSGERPWGLVLAASALGATCLVCAWRAVVVAGGHRVGLVAAATLAVGLHQLSTDGIGVPWTPTIVILPVTAALVCLAATWTRGAWWTAAAGVLCATMAAQAHFGSFGLGMAIAVGCLIAVCVGRRRLGLPLPAARLGVVVLVAAVPWVPVAVDQVVGAHNATAVARYALTGKVSERFPASVGRPGADLTLVDASRRLLQITSLSKQGTALWAGTDLVAGESTHPTPLSDLAGLVLLGAAAWCSRPRRWRRAVEAEEAPPDLAGDFARVLCRLGLAGLALQAFAMLRIRHDYRPYLATAAAGVGLATWLGIGVSAAVGVRRLASRRSVADARVRLAGIALPVVVAVAAVSGLASSVRPMAQVPPDDRASELRILRAIRGDRVEVRINDHLAQVPTLVLTIRLEHDGQTVAARVLRAHFSDTQRRAPIDGARLLVLGPPETWPQGCKDLGTYETARVCLTPKPG